MKVNLFSTCLAEELFPSVLKSARAVLEGLGIEVAQPRAAFCCGQAAFNEGMREQALDLARRFLDTYSPETPLVVPSGSCTSMLKVFYPDLLADHPDYLAKARALIPSVHEFSDFVVNVLKVDDVGASFPHSVTYHPSCHLLRELHLAQPPLRLLSKVRGLTLVEMPRATECCGFGGLFSVKFPEISGAMLEDKLQTIRQTAAEVLVANDCGCLMQIGGGLSRANSPVKVRHLAQILASRE
jgi:L-lactate dehydrogenase complex protein LldE